MDSDDFGPGPFTPEELAALKRWMDRNSESIAGINELVDVLGVELYIDHAGLVGFRLPDRASLPK